MGCAARTIGSVFEAVVAASPEAVAVLDAASGNWLSYSQLNQRANRIAGRLLSLGVQPGELVALCAGRNPTAVAGLLGILKAGAAYLPLDPADPPARLGLLLADARVRVACVEEAAAANLPASLSLRVSLELAALPSAERDENPPLPASPSAAPGNSESLAYVLYTSGSTGTPKGVAVAHRAVLRLVQGQRYARFGADEIVLQLAPLSFDASTFEIWGALLHGARLITLGGKPSLEQIGRAVREHRVTTLWLTAGLFALMADERLDDLRGLRQLLAGGDVLPLPQVRRVLEGAPGVRLINGYGPTECTTFACCHQICAADVASDRPIPIGAPLEGTNALVLDEKLEPVADGETGELALGGAGLALGYLERPELTAERFIPAPGGERLYRTGDLARRRKDGVFEFLGRLDGQIKLRGYRIELGELEAALAAHPLVQSAAAAVREPRPGDKRLCAYVVPRGEASIAGLREYLASRLPAWLLPSAIVSLARLPLSASGKVDRRALPDPEALAEGQAGPTQSTQSTQPVERAAPRAELEALIGSLWREVLLREQVSLHDNFFEIGGSSLHLLAVHARLCAALRREVPVTELFEFPTVGSLAARLGAIEEAPQRGAVQDRAARQRAALGRRARGP